GRLGGDAQLPGNLAIGGTAGDEGQHLDLPGGEASRSRSSFALALARAGQDRVYRHGVETAGADVPPKLRRGLLGGHCWTVRAWFGHGVIGTGGGEQPTGGGNGRPGQTAVVSGTVAAFVSQCGDGAQPREGRRPGEHPL